MLTHSPICLARALITNAEASSILYGLYTTCQIRCNIDEITRQIGTCQDYLYTG